MAERPTKIELLEAIRRFVDRELVPELEGVRRFHARVASNALGILAREIELEGPSLTRRYAALCGLLNEAGAEPGDLAAFEREVDRLERTLTERIRAGEADAGPFRERVLEYLGRCVRERLAINNPDYR